MCGVASLHAGSGLRRREEQRQGCHPPPDGPLSSPGPSGTGPKVHPAQSRHVLSAPWPVALAHQEGTSGSQQEAPRETSGGVHRGQWVKEQCWEGSGRATAGARGPDSAAPAASQLQPGRRTSARTGVTLAHGGLGRSAFSLLLEHHSSDRTGPPGQARVLGKGMSSRDEAADKLSSRRCAKPGGRSSRGQTRTPPDPAPHSVAGPHRE